ncbi:PREDICTED: bifunctional glutamate/proline--tRNA ligase [Dinoponera quadriceps]|uniref:Bifunctional glutamate/proline--tRNA ligase n=1 Tax=Dinoponera quadriceps TaxID=609295 RepID=A0A6P3WZ17_DINQU|nr:PREDICTED: bifunctional glutamate/proline--tRNA ligase [Dinoponera quadriceps]XP_014470890.1 PREDICTED: bifunctional glutamate/proline--tRNA ligase [Dinoponera quadriceps]XP_014470891.1 PREDICTED: bifunctional glutamate/proline--tRNA ligase [Dinoponera quadriceps]
MDLTLRVNSYDPSKELIIATELIKSQKQHNVTIIWQKELDEQGKAGLYDNTNDKLLLTRSNDIVRFLARTLDPKLYGDIKKSPPSWGSAQERTEVDHWISFAIGQLSADVLDSSNFEYLDHILQTRTWLVAKVITLADIYVFCVLLNRDVTKTYSDKYRNIARWFEQTSKHEGVSVGLRQVELNSIAPAKPNVANANVRKQEGKFIDLPGAEMGKVVVRFPPEASGYLHIGHAKAALLNQYYAEAFQGQLIMRFDDTNPAKETVEFENAILEDLKSLEIKPDQFTHTSDYFDVIKKYCTALIESGHAYVDDTPAHVMKEQREQKVKSDNRDNTVEKNLALWEEMRRGTEKGQECCVRAKIDYESMNGCMRDPTIYRCKSEPHPRTGDKYKVYPTYDFACPIVDSIENVTHTLRTMEYRDRDPQFAWILEALGLRKPHIWEYSRLNMTHTVLSKRKLTWFVNEGFVDGWDDPRFPTVRGILRRGMTVEGLKQFIIAQGSSKSVVFMHWDKIWAFNKKVIDPIAVRYTALDSDKTVPVEVMDAKEEWLTVQNHPKDPSKGTKRVRVGPKIFIEKEDAESLVEGQNTTFISWGNLTIRKIEKKDGTVVGVKTSLNLDDKNYKDTLKITWLAAPLATESDEKPEEADAVPCYAVYFDHIMSVPVLGKDDDFKNFVAKETRKEVEMLGEVELKRVKKGEIIELRRKGFFICDVPYAPVSPYSSREQSVILFHIPDGRMAPPSKVANAAPSMAAPSANVPSGEQTRNAQVINEKIVAQGDKVRRLKTEKADKATVDVEVKALLALKAEYKTSTGEDWKPGVVSKTPKAESNDAVELSEEIAQQRNKVAELQKQLDEELKKLQKLEAKRNEKKTDAGDRKGDRTQKRREDRAKQRAESGKEKSVDDAKTGDKEAAERISQEIEKQGDKVRSLKSSKAEKSVVDQEVKTLLSLKNDYKNATGQDWKPVATSLSSSNATPKKKKKEEQAKSGKTAEKEVAKASPAAAKDANKTGTRLGLEVRKLENFFEWYSQVITKCGMIEYYDVSGCYIFRPWSFAIWKIIKEYIDRDITALGVQECYFPIFVTRAALEKEKQHIADFAPEVAWVTKCGKSDLAEPVALRPTSETVMYPAYAKWLKSDTELPLKLNQWNNIVRWEFKDPKPFLRTREFLWQEGHTAFATKEEADEEVLIILDLYRRVYEDLLAVPVVKGRKTEKEKFAGSDYTTTVEAFISASGRAIQGATSHHLGQIFSTMFNIQVEGAAEGDEKTFVYQNSWGLTTRTIGVMIMVHGDDRGLVLPPMVATIQAIVVPCGITASTTMEQREQLQSECVKLVDELSKDGRFRVKGDFRGNRTPGWKFNHWELRGVPVRIEIGPAEVQKRQVTFVRRDNFEKHTTARDQVIPSLDSLLKDIQSRLFNKAREDLEMHIKRAETWADFCRHLDNNNLVLSPFCGKPSCEDNIKADSARGDTSEEIGALSMGAKSLCIPFEQPELTKSLDEMKCIHDDCRDKPKYYTLFGRSY